MSYHILRGYSRGFLLFFAAALMVVAVNSSSAPREAYLDAVWLGATDGVTKLDAGTGLPLFKIDDPVDAQAVSVDPELGHVWIFSQGSIFIYDFDGNHVNTFLAPSTLLHAIDVPYARAVIGAVHLRNGICFLDGLALGSLPKDAMWANALLEPGVNEGTAWLSLGNKLFLYNSSGKLLEELDAKGLITGITVDVPREKTWVSTCTGLIAFDANGK